VKTRCRLRRKNLFLWADAALKKESYTKIAKNSQQACKLLFSWGWMVVDKLAGSINFERNGAHHTNGTLYSLISNF